MCAAAQTERKAYVSVLNTPTHDSASLCEVSTPPAARGTANNTPFFSPATLAVGAAENFTAENFGGKSFQHSKDSVPCRSSLLMEYSANRSRMFFVADAPSQRQRQVSCWPHTSFGSKRKKEEVSKSLFVDFTNKFKASNFHTRRPPEGSLRVDLHHLVFVFDLDSVFSLWWFPIEPSL